MNKGDFVRIVLGQGKGQFDQICHADDRGVLLERHSGWRLRASLEVLPKETMWVVNGHQSIAARSYFDSKEAACNAARAESGQYPEILYVRYMGDEISVIFRDGVAYHRE